MNCLNPSSSLDCYPIFPQSHRASIFKSLENQLPGRVETRLSYHLLMLSSLVSACALLWFSLGVISYPFMQVPSITYVLPMIKLGIGGSFVIRNVSYNPILPKSVITSFDLSQNQKTFLGKICGKEHWKEVVYKKGDRFYEGYLDASTLDQEGNGIVYVYVPKTIFQHYSISFMVMTATPLYIVGAIAYNIFRTFLIPFYIAWRLLLQAGGFVQDSAQFKFTDIPKEMGISIWRVIRALRYGVAFFFASFYSLLDHLNGRKLASYIEREWNDGVMRHEGVWIILPQKSFKFEGGGDPENLGRNGYYLPGCWQPFAIGNVKNHKLIQAVTASSNAHPIDIYFRSDFQNPL